MMKRSAVHGDVSAISHHASPIEDHAQRAGFSRFATSKLASDGDSRKPLNCRIMKRDAGTYHSSDGIGVQSGQAAAIADMIHFIQEVCGQTVVKPPEQEHARSTRMRRFLPENTGNPGIAIMGLVSG